MNPHSTRLFVASLLIVPLVSASAAPAVKPSPAKKTVAATSPQLAPKAALSIDTLAIPIYKDVPDEFSFSGTQKDLLGLVQSLARGLAADDKPVSPDMNGVSQLFSEKALLDMIGQIHVLNARSLSFKSMTQEAREKAFKVTPPASGITSEYGSGNERNKLEQKKLGEAQTFFADKFVKAGGKPQLTLHNDRTSVAIYVFQSPGSWALLTRGPSRVIVVRADGYPDLALFGRLFRQIASQK